MPKTGEPVAMLKDFTLEERKVVEIRPEEHLGMIRVSGAATQEGCLCLSARAEVNSGPAEILQVGEIMVVPAENVNVSVDDKDIEEGLKVEAWHAPRVGMASRNALSSISLPL